MRSVVGQFVDLFEHELQELLGSFLRRQFAHRRMERGDHAAVGLGPVVVLGRHDVGAAFAAFDEGARTLPIPDLTKQLGQVRAGVGHGDLGHAVPRDLNALLSSHGQSVSHCQSFHSFQPLKYCGRCKPAPPDAPASACPSSPKEAQMAVSNSPQPEEVWEPIPAYEGMYEASDRGRIRSLDRTVTRTDGRTRRLNGRVLKVCIDANTGYPKVTLYREAAPTHRYVHALVAEAFLGPRPDGAEVAHRDGVKTNASLTNLRYATSTENSADQLLHGTSNRGARNPAVVLTENAVLAIALGLQAGAKQKDLAARFGVSRTAISAISTGRSWGHLTGRGSL